MPYPDKPTISTSYTAKAQALGDGTLPGVELDIDLAALRNAVDVLNDFVRGVTRSDGRLANASVRKETLAADVLIGFDAPTAWVTSNAYDPQDTVFEANKFYICLTAHTSSVFADDLAAGRWAILADFTTVTAAAEAARTAAEAALDSFDDRYLGPKASDPSADNDGASLLDGALYWNSSTGTMRVYSLSAAAWQDVSNNAPIRTFTYTATSGQTAFTGADAAGVTLQYDAGFESVFLNGVRLVAVTDYARTSSGTITLTAGAAAGDTVQITAFSGFTAVALADLATTQTVSGNWNFTGQFSLGGAQVTASAAELNQLDGTTITSFAKTILDDANAAATRTTLQLGTAATVDVIDEDNMVTDSATRPPSQQSVKAYVDALPRIGAGQTWQDVAGSRTKGTSYQNTTGRSIQVMVSGSNGSGNNLLDVSVDGSTWIAAADVGGNSRLYTASAIIPPGWYYRVPTAAETPGSWVELR